MASYFGKTLDMMFGSEIYGTRKVMMPAPVFYVFYLGKPDAPEVETFRLSDHYKENAPENSIEVVVKVYNICYSEKLSWCLLGESNRWYNRSCKKTGKICTG